MGKYKCPHCKTSGSTQKTCDYCHTNFCTACDTTVYGADITVVSATKCPICGNVGKVHKVDDVILK